MLKTCVCKLCLSLFFVFTRVPEMEFKPFKELFHPGFATLGKKDPNCRKKKLQGSSSAACARAFTSALVKEVASTKDKDKHILTLKVKEQAVRIGKV